MVFLFLVGWIVRWVTLLFNQRGEIEMSTAEREMGDTAETSIEVRVVYKYPLFMADGDTHPDPFGRANHTRFVESILTYADAKLLSVDVIEETPCLWALVNPSMPEVERRLLITGTGIMMSKILPEGLDFIGTFKLYGGSFIGHVFG